MTDGEASASGAGERLKIAHDAKHRFSGTADAGINDICIQVKEKALNGFTDGDAPWNKIRFLERDAVNRFSAYSVTLYRATAFKNHPKRIRKKASGSRQAQ